jgi:hypothetical protein
MTVSQLSGRVAAAALFLSLCPAVAHADEMAWRVVSYLTKNEQKPVGDVEGHVKGEFVRRGLAFFSSGPAKGEVAAWVNVGTFENTKGKGVAHAESTFTFEDGSSFTVRNVTESEPGPRGLSVGKVTVEFSKGTGRFEGITGKGSGTGRNVTPASGETKGDAFYDLVVTYTLPKSRT